MRSLPATITAFVLALSWAPGARAQSEEDAPARVQYRQAIELFEEGKLEQAAVAFERAYELRPSYRIMFNLGQTLMELGRYAAALNAYTRYLAEGGGEIPADRATQVRKEIAELNTLVGMIVIACKSAGATVFVENRNKGETPLADPVFVDLGEHEVVVRRGATELHREVVKVAGGQRVVVTVADDASPPPPMAADEPERKERLWTWVALGVGGAAAVGAAVTGALALGAMSDLEQDCPDLACPASKRSAIDRGKNLALTADVLTGVAAVGIAAGVVLFFVEPGLGNKEVIVAPAATPGGGGLALTGRF